MRFLIHVGEIVAFGFQRTIKETMKEKIYCGKVGVLLAKVKAVTGKKPK